MSVHLLLTDCCIYSQCIWLYRTVSARSAVSIFPSTSCSPHSRYLGPIDRVADLHGQWALRSASSSRLVVPMFRPSTVGSRTFNVSGPRIWNGLHKDIVSVRHRHFQVSGANLNPSFSSSHILILSSNCTLDTTVVLVVIFIT